MSVRLAIGVAVVMEESERVIEPTQRLRRKPQVKNREVRVVCSYGEAKWSRESLASANTRADGTGVLKRRIRKQVRTDWE